MSGIVETELSMHHVLTSCLTSSLGVCPAVGSTPVPVIMAKQTLASKTQKTLCMSGVSLVGPLPAASGLSSSGEGIYLETDTLPMLKTCIVVNSEFDMLPVGEEAWRLTKWFL